MKGNLDVLANQKETCTMKTGLLGVDEIQQSNDAQVCRQSLVRHQPRQRLVHIIQLTNLKCCLPSNGSAIFAGAYPVRRFGQLADHPKSIMTN